MNNLIDLSEITQTVSEMDMKNMLNSESVNKELDAINLEIIKLFSNQLLEYMNGTYGKTCKDTFAFDSFHNELDSNQLICKFKSKLCPNDTVLVSYNTQTRSIATNYMELYYMPPMYDYLKEIANLLFKEDFVIFYLSTADKVDSNYDFTCDQKTYLREHGCSTRILLPENSDWVKENKFDDILNIFLDACNAADIKLNFLDICVVTELPKEKYKSFDEFYDKCDATILEHNEYYCTRE